MTGFSLFGLTVAEAVRLIELYSLNGGDQRGSLHEQKYATSLPRTSKNANFRPARKRTRWRST